MKEGEKNPTEAINLEVITNYLEQKMSLSIPLLAQGQPQISSAPQSQGQEVAVTSSSSHGKGHTGHLCFVCYLFNVEVCPIHFSISVKSKFLMIGNSFENSTLD